MPLISKTDAGSYNRPPVTRMKTIALIVVTITTLLGASVGITSGYIGGRFDTWLQRFVELILAFPQLPLYLALTSLIPVTA